MRNSGRTRCLGSLSQIVASLVELICYDGMTGKVVKDFARNGIASAHGFQKALIDLVLIALTQAGRSQVEIGQMQIGKPLQNLPTVCSIIS
jgi:hypothetical protein